MNKKLGIKFEHLEKEILDGIEHYNDINTQLVQLKNEVNKYKFTVVSEPAISNEELVFNLIKDDLEDIQSKCELRNWQHLIKGCSQNSHSFFKQCLFLAIMKGVHKMIQGDDLERVAEIVINDDDYSVHKSVRLDNNRPDFFYFSSVEHAEKAGDILNDFFGVCILDWWYKS